MTRPPLGSPEDRGLDATREHILTQSRHGGHTEHNVDWACRRCNNLRGDMPYEAFRTFARVVLRTYPDAPTPVLRVALRQHAMHIVEMAARRREDLGRAASNALLYVGSIVGG